MLERGCQRAVLLACLKRYLLLDGLGAGGLEAHHVLAGIEGNWLSVERLGDGLAVHCHSHRQRIGGRGVLGREDDGGQAFVDLGEPLCAVLDHVDGAGGCAARDCLLSRVEEVAALT